MKNLPDQITIQPNEGNGAPYHGYEGGDGVVYVPREPWSTDMDAAPKDGTLIDLIVDGVRVPDVRFDIPDRDGFGFRSSQFPVWVNLDCDVSGFFHWSDVEGKPTHWRHIDLPQTKETK